MKKLTALALVAALAAFGAAGCGTMTGAVADRVGDRMDDAVADYCDRDERARAAVRDRVGEAVSPNAITVECAGDG